MVCSEKELGLSDDHTGILLLDPEAPVGTPLLDVLGDTVLEVELTPNLARVNCVLGLAREVAALTGWSVLNVRMRAFRARRKAAQLASHLRDELEP